MLTPTEKETGSVRAGGRRGAALLPSLVVGAVLLGVVGFAVTGAVERATVGRKTSQVRADLRTYAIALEAYHVDWQDYPQVVQVDPIGGFINFPIPLEDTLLHLSTPVSYMPDAFLPEPFNDHTGWSLYKGWSVLDEAAPPPDAATRQTIYFYFSYPKETLDQTALASAYRQLSPVSISNPEANEMVRRNWGIASPGPDGEYLTERFFGQFPEPYRAFVGLQSELSVARLGGGYDPTNGLGSQGDIVRFQGAFTPTPTPLPPLTPAPRDNSVKNWSGYE